MTLVRISPEDLVSLHTLAQEVPLRCDLVYARAEHPENIFGRLYRPDAGLWAHRTLAGILVLAAQTCFAEKGWFLVVKDVLRTIEAQQAMMNSPIVRANPHWTVGTDRLVSPPGTGGHPRAMAADLTLETETGDTVPMGTPFDFLSEDPHRNPAARSYTDLPAACLENRRFLERAMTDAASHLGTPLLPLPAEWWDFRLPPEIYEKYEPLSDADLPHAMRMT